MRIHPVSGLVVGALLLALPSCGSSYSDICQAEVDCEGGNDADVDACVEGARGQKAVASVYDCSDAFDKYVDCLTENSSCQVDDKGRRKYTSNDTCKSLASAVESCEKAASAKGK